jgi:DNA-binding LacI/PurR family transcriptional regulator
MTSKIRDVARLAGVSPGTVSRVIHNKGYISRVTKKKVLAAIEKLNYRPHAVASRLGSGKTHIIGLLVPDFQESYYVEITDAIVETAKETGYSLLVTTTHKNKSHLPDFLRSGNMDGLLVITPYYVEEELAFITQQEIPCVLINYAAEGQHFSSVYCDQFKVGYLATQYLINLGHTQIGLCTSDTNSPSPMKRFQGCVQALSDAKLDVRGNHIRDMSPKLNKDPIKEMRDWIIEGDLPSAMFVFSDDIALYVMDALKEAGYRIPTDISIIGCGNMLFSERTLPPLTTVDQNMYQMGIWSFKMLLRLINENDNMKNDVKIIEPRLVIRESCRKIQHTHQTSNSSY